VSTKLLPDDAHFLVVVNVRQALASPLYAANLRKAVEDALKNEKTPPPVRDAVPVLLRDVDRLTVVTDDACFSEGPGGGPILIAEGRLGPDWLRARAKELNAAVPGVLKEADQNGVAAFEVAAPPAGPGGYFLAPDRNTVVFVPQKEQAKEFLEKAAGKRATALKHPALREQLRNMTPDAAVQWVGVQEMVFGATSKSAAGPGGKRTAERKLQRLGDEGIEGVSGSLTVDDALQFRLTLTARDADVAGKFLQETNKVLEEMAKELQRELPRHKGLEPVLKEIGGVKVAQDGKSVAVTGRFTAETVRGLVQTWAEEVGLAPPGK
jgi:hypothetical protein